MAIGLFMIDELVTKYKELDGAIAPRPLGNGHINDTYYVESPKGKFVLQRINEKIFDIGALMRNLDIVFGAIEKAGRRGAGIPVPQLLKNKDGEYHTLTSEGSVWRLWEYIEGSKTYKIAPHEKISRTAAETMGVFQEFLNTLPPEDFQETIKNFHDPLRRYGELEKTLETAAPSRKEKAAAQIDFLLSHNDIALKTRKLTGSGTLALRVIHNDPKLENILFVRGGKALIIDPDTIMPGYVMFDYGDMVRSFCNSAAEDEQDSTKVEFRISHLESLTEGYLTSLKSLSVTEKNSLKTGTAAIIYEQALRFLTDYLRGDIYYKTEYPRHNLTRATNQIILLEGFLRLKS